MTDRPALAMAHDSEQELREIVAKHAKVPTITRALTAADARFVTRLPPGVVETMNRLLDHHQGKRGPGRALQLHLALDDKTGTPVAFGTYVTPPREWA
jgi:hypothetical protein